MLTVWFGLWDATIENGCLEVIPGSHREGLLHHCHTSGAMSRGFGLHVPDWLLRQGDGVPLPMKQGDALFFHRLNCHSSLPNRSDNIRWSFDLRYNPIGQPTGSGIVSGLRRAQPFESAKRVARSFRVGEVVARGEKQTGPQRGSDVQPLEGGRSGLRVSEACGW